MEPGRELPSTDTMWAALISRDPSFDGVFVAAVMTTGVYCRPTCPARKPHRRNVEFFASAAEARSAGFRPCGRCRPLETSGDPPVWIRSLLAAVERDPTRRWLDRDIRELGLDPVRVRRWFQRQYGMTFHGQLRARRLGSALAAMRDGRSILDAGLDHGWESSSGFRDAFSRLTGVPPGRGRRRQPRYLSSLSTPLGPTVMSALDDR
jgi:AraC family transcriptional regulator, regulatory protein of adaptative response / methylated-DNA-[protein]-cysteine methyltransferase